MSFKTSRKIVTLSLRNLQLHNYGLQPRFSQAFPGYGSDTLGFMRLSNWGTIFGHLSCSSIWLTVNILSPSSPSRGQV